MIDHDKSEIDLRLILWAELVETRRRLAEMLYSRPPDCVDTVTLGKPDRTRELYAAVCAEVERRELARIEAELKRSEALARE